MDWLVSNVLFSRPKETIDTCSSSSANNQPSSTSNTSSSQSTKLILNKYQSQELPCSQHECLCTPVMIENHVDMLEIPPPYDSSKSNTPRRTNSTPTYTQQFVNKLRDTKSKLGYQQEHTKPIVDKKSLSQGMKLVEIAVEEFESGNEAIGLDVYLSGLDKIIMSLPNLKDPRTKETLKEKLFSLEERIGIQTQSKLYQEHQTNPGDDADNQSSSNLASKLSEISQLLVPSWLITLINHDSNDNHNDQSSIESCETGDSLLKFKKLSRAITDMIIRCVVLFKQSPIPGLLYLIFSYFMHLVLWVEHQFNIMEKLQNIGIGCIKIALIADEKYHLHEYASEALYSIVSALLRAIVAYKDTPPPSNSTSNNQNQEITKTNSLSILPKSLSA